LIGVKVWLRLCLNSIMNVYWHGEKEEVKQIKGKEIKKILEEKKDKRK